MKRSIYFDTFDQDSWPESHELEPYFLAPKGQQWSYLGGNDNWGLTAKGVDGTDHLEPNKGRINVFLYMIGHPELGVLLVYQKKGGGINEDFSSKGDISRLKEWVRTLQGDQMPVGLFVPFEGAWEAVKEFMDTDGDLPKSIEWVENSTLPEGTFPAP